MKLPVPETSGTDSGALICNSFENNILQSLKDCLSDACRLEEAKLPVQTVFLASVSGGADSMALLNALYNIKTADAPFNFQLYVLHVEHGLRPSEESRGDAEFVRVFCKERGIPCTITHIPPGKIASFAKRKGSGIEAAARHFRYKALVKEAESISIKLLGEKNICKPCMCILTAHTKDDALELALMRVLRGCGPAGLAAMHRTVKREKLKESSKGICKERKINQFFLIRPMLEMTRNDVLSYLTAKGLSWREDATNGDFKFLRNKVRGVLIPLLNEIFPSWKKGLSAMAQTQSLAADFIAEEARQRVKWLPSFKKTLATKAENFFMQPQIIREEALFQAADELLKSFKNRRTVKRVVARRFCAGLETAADLGAFRVRRAGENIIISAVSEEYFEKWVSSLIKGL